MAFPPLARGQRDTSRWRLLGLTVVAAALHLPFTPLFALVGLAGWALAPPEPLPDTPVEPARSIPVSLVEDAPLAPPSPPEPRVAAALPPPKPGPTPSPPKPRPRPQAPKPEEKPAVEPKAPAELVDPLALAGSVGEVADPNANVRLLVYTDRLRENAHAVAVDEILSGLHQWKDFLGPAGLRPLRDLDRLLIAGPELRDTSKMIVVAEHHVPPKALHAAVDALVERSAGGKWLAQTPPLALARADRAMRLIALPNDHVAVVAPLAAEEQLGKLAADLRFPDGNAPPDDASREVVALYMAEPAKVLGGLFRLPPSLAWLRAVVSVRPEGGALIRLVAEDATPELALRHAPELTRAFNAATELDLILFKQRFVERARFTARGKRLEADVVVTRSQLNTLVTTAHGYLVPPSGAPPTRAAAGSAPSGPGLIAPRTPPAAAGSSEAPITPAPRAPDVAAPAPLTPAPARAVP